MKIVIIVDMQNDFVSGALGTQEAQYMLPVMKQTMKDLAEKDVAFIFTRDTHAVNYAETLEGMKLPVIHCVEDTEGWAIDQEIWDTWLEIKDKTRQISGYDAFCTDHVINKPTFGSLDLQNLLYNLDAEEQIEEIILMGVCTGICVLSNAILCKATLPNTPVSVINKCCACVTPESHKTAIDAMKLCQIDII